MPGGSVLVPGKLVGVPLAGRGQPDRHTLHAEGPRPPPRRHRQGGGRRRGKLRRASRAADPDRRSHRGRSARAVVGQVLQPEQFLVTRPGADFGAEAGYAVLYTSLATRAVAQRSRGQVNELVLALTPGADPALVETELRRAFAATAPGCRRDVHPQGRRGRPPRPLRGRPQRPADGRRLRLAAPRRRRIRLLQPRHQGGRVSEARDRDRHGARRLPGQARDPTAPLRGRDLAARRRGRDRRRAGLQRGLPRLAPEPPRASRLGDAAAAGRLRTCCRARLRRPAPGSRLSRCPRRPRPPRRRDPGRLADGRRRRPRTAARAAAPTRVEPRQDAVPESRAHTATNADEPARHRGRHHRSSSRSPACSTPSTARWRRATTRPSTATRSG